MSKPSKEEYWRLFNSAKDDAELDAELDGKDDKLRELWNEEKLNLQRKWFTAGAKAQREADTRFLQAVRDEMPDARAFEEYDEAEKDEIEARAIHIGEAIIRLTGWKDGLAAAPLVKFEEAGDGET